jgi:hypothetical protein
MHGAPAFLTPLVALAMLSAALASPIAGAATVSTKSSPNGQTLFPEKQFGLQCWQDGNRIVDEKSLNTMTVDPKLNDKLISFKQSPQNNKDERQVILITMGRALCVAKTQ